MSKTKKENRQNTDRISRKYDKIYAVVYKGEKQKIQSHLKETRETMSGFLNRLIAKEIDDFEPIESENMSVKK